MQIDIKLDKDFSIFFHDMLSKYGEQMASVNGLGESQLDYTDFINNFVDKKVAADASIDGNANASTKDVTSLENEMAKPHSKLLAYNKIFKEIKKKWGYRTARKWAEEEWNGCFYMHDFPSASFKSYCYAYDLTQVAEKGLFFVNNFNGQPPKHLVTFTDFVGETVSWVSNRTSGGCALPDFLIYSYYFWKKDIENRYFVKNPEYYRDQEFQRIIYKLNQPYLRITQSAFTSIQIYDREYLVALFGGKIFPDGSFVIDVIDEIIEYQKAFMEVCSQIRSQNMMTFPVLSYALIRENGKFADEDFAKWCCRHNMKWADSNFYVSSDVTSLSSCCRLKNNIENLGYFNSIGGTALEVGSVKVNTVNLARIAYETKDKKKYLKLVKERITTALKALDRVRHIIGRNISKGLLPNYTYELVHLKNQYNTIGLNGMYEAIKYLGDTYEDEFGNIAYTQEGQDFGVQILKVIHEAIDEFVKNENIEYKINIEQIPGERAAAVLQTKDKMLYEDGVYDLPLYGNQWIPLGTKTTLHNKLSASKDLDEACSGGSIAHINIDAPFTNFDMAWEMLNKVADYGVPYFAFCTRISACKNNHGFYGDVCPNCGEPKATTYQRIVGFLTPEKSYSKERKEEFEKRTWFNVNHLTE